MFQRNSVHGLHRCYNYSLDNIKPSNFCLSLYILYKVHMPKCRQGTAGLLVRRGQASPRQTAGSSWLQWHFHCQGWALLPAWWCPWKIQLRAKYCTFSEEWWKKTWETDLRIQIDNKDSPEVLLTPTQSQPGLQHLISTPPTCIPTRHRYMRDTRHSSSSAN